MTTAKRKKKATRKKRTSADDEADEAAPRARALWKGELLVGDDRLAVKLFAAAQGRDVSFRLLHRDDLTPVRQRSVDPESGDEVAGDALQRGFEVETGVLVVIDDDDLAGLVPEKSRDIEVLGYVVPDLIAEPLYERPYHVAPDGEAEAYLAFAKALLDSGKVALVRWVMRNKRYAGALAAREGRLLLTTLRRADEVVLLQGYQAPAGRALDPKERDLAHQLVSALEGAFEPDEFHEEYSQRVAELVAAKSEGKELPRKRAAPREEPSKSLAVALRESLRKAKEKGVA